ncbi:MAG: Fpg/Nei family DNA glycosylase, partial [Alphaproteobacteria bacterium]
MPEGHTIHRLALDLERDLVGHRVQASSPQGRFPEADEVDGRVLRSTEAIGKHLLLHFGPGGIVHVHLGLFGRFRRQRDPVPPPRDTTRLRLEGPERTWDLVGPTICELLSTRGLRELRARLGVDPIAARTSRDALDRTFASLARTRRDVGSLLLDQGVFSGIGNVYRAEILFLLGIDPATPARELTRRDFDAIWSKSRELLRLGVAERRIVTVRDKG